MAKMPRMGSRCTHVVTLCKGLPGSVPWPGCAQLIIGEIIIIMKNTKKLILFLIGLDLKIFNHRISEDSKNHSNP